MVSGVVQNEHGHYGSLSGGRGHLMGYAVDANVVFASDVMESPPHFRRRYFVQVHVCQDGIQLGEIKLAGLWVGPVVQ